VRFSQAFATAVGGTSLFLAYKGYMPVKAVKTLAKKPDGSDVNLYLAGLRELKLTMTTLGKTDLNAARFLVGSTFAEASLASFTNLAITYLSEQVRIIFPGRQKHIHLYHLCPSLSLSLLSPSRTHT
jgi:hypothetical protein